MKVINSYPVDLLAGAVKSEPTLIYTRWKTLQIRRSKPTSFPPATPGQDTWRQLLSDASGAWSALSTETREIWESIAKNELVTSPFGNYRRTGYTQFIRAYMRGSAAGFDMPPLPLDIPSPALMGTYTSIEVDPSPANWVLTYMPITLDITSTRLVFYGAGPFTSIARKPKSSEWRLMVPLGSGPSFKLLTSAPVQTFSGTVLWTSLSGLVGKYVWIRSFGMLIPNNSGQVVTQQILVTAL